MAIINFSLPLIPSFTSTTPDKLVDVKLFDGSITQQLLFIPDIKVISNFAKGELGIADGIMKSMIFKNLSKVSNPKAIEQFLKSVGGKLPGPVENYIKDGKFNLDPKLLSLLPTDNNLGGLKALEKTMIQSIFETQKPYMEVIKLVLENLVKIEDIIARVLAVSGSSMKPKNNPKALGYAGNSDFSKKVAQLDGITKSNTGPVTPTESEGTPESLTEDPSTKGKIYVTQSVVYSTGEFNPAVEYTYIYQYAKEKELDLNGTFSIPPITGDEHLPRYVVFGVFDSNWNPIDERLILTPPQEARLDGTIEKNINWLNRSGKWFGKFDQIKEGEDFEFEKDSFGAKIKYGSSGPTVKVGGDTRFIKKDLKRVKNINNLENLYSLYYKDETSRRATEKGLSGSQVQNIVEEISSKLSTADSGGTSGIQTTIEAVLENGFLNTSDNTNTTGLQQGGFGRVKYPFKPKKVTFQGKEVWVDPEAKYDMKIIKCDSSTDITFLDIEKDNKQFKTTKILRFVKNTLSIRLSDNSDFYYEIQNLTTQSSIARAGNTREISFDNTRGGFFGTSFSPAIDGKITIFGKYMAPEYRNGIIFASGNFNYRLYKFSDTWKIELIYWTINSNTREGDIVSLGPSQIPSDKDSDGNKRLKVRFPNKKLYYFSPSDGQLLYTDIYTGKQISSIQPEDNQKAELIINIDNLDVTRTTSIIPPNSIRVQDDRYKFGRLISNTQVLNDKLADKTKAFSTGFYGSPKIKIEKNGNKTILAKQSVSQIYRYQQTSDDTETYFIIEGVLSSKNKNKLVPSQNTNNSSSSGDDYYLPDLIGAIPVFIEMLIDVFSKLIPNITSLINLISNPAKFVTDIIIAKIGDNNGTEPEKFGVFSKKFLDDLKKLSSIAKSGVNSNLENIRKLDLKKKLEDFVNKSKLKNYVLITPEGTPKFLLDGVATIKLFGDAPMLEKLPGINFGLDVNLTNLALGGLLPSNSFDLKDIISKPSNLDNQLSGIAKSLGQSVGSSLKNAVPLVTKLSNDLTKTGQDLISSTNDTLSNTIGQLQGDLSNIINQSGVGLINQLQGNLSNTINQASVAALGLGNQLQSGISGVSSQLGTVAGNLSNQLQSGISNVTSQLGNLTSGLAGQLGGNITNLTNQLQSGLGNAIGNISKSLPFNLIFDNFEPFSNFTLPELSGLVNVPNIKIPKSLTNFNFEPSLNLSNDIITKINPNKFLVQALDIQKKVQSKIKDLNYEYIYLYQTLQKKILEAQKFDEIGDPKKALALLEDAIKIDPENGLIKELLDKVKKKADTAVQPVFKFLLNIVTTPLKVIFGIVSYIMDLFKSFLNPFELPGKIVDFVSFKWILDFFNPTSKNSVFQIIGMKFDIETFLKDYVPRLLANLPKNVNGLTSQLQVGINNLPDQLKSGVSTLQNSISGFGNQFSGLASQVSSSLSSNINQLQSGIGGLASQLGGGVSGAVSQLQGNITGFTNQLGGNINQLQGNITGLAAQLGGGVSGAVNQLQGNITGFTSQVGGGINQLQGNITGLATQLGGGISGAVNQLQGNVSTTINQLQGGIGGLANQLEGSVSNLSKRFQGEASDALNKLQSFDMSKIINMPFFAGKLPTYNLQQFDFFFNSRNGTPSLTFPSFPVFPKLPSIPTALLSNILCFIESIINSLIDFIWSTLGLGSVIPAPHLKLCRDSNQNLSPNDILDLLNGNFKDPSKASNVAGVTGSEPSYNFIFNIKTSDGRDIRQLNQEELNKWVEENRNIQFDFNL